MRDLSIKIKTLTPLWTGGIDTTMDRIHETGIIGSLRWWYEAIVRGLGGSACDPTAGEKCQYDARDKRSPEEQLCPACYIFGTTGWRRRFRLETQKLVGKIDVSGGMFPSGRIHQGNPYRVGGWFLQGGYHGELELKFSGDERILLCEILPMLLFMEKWGALGAKTSIGYGVFEITEIKVNGQAYHKGSNNWQDIFQTVTQAPCKNSRVGKWWWNGDVDFGESLYSGVFPALSNMFFSKIRLEVEDGSWWRSFREIQWLEKLEIPESEATWIGKNNPPSGPYKIRNSLSVERIAHWVEYHNTFPLSPIVRNTLRYQLTSDLSSCNMPPKEEPSWCKDFFGTTNGPKDAERIKSKLIVSWTYRASQNQWEFRIWGWIPDELEGGVKRDVVLSHLKQWLGIKDENGQTCWMDAENGELWQRIKLNNPKICWMEMRYSENVNSEDVKNYLKRLVNSGEIKDDGS